MPPPRRHIRLTFVETGESVVAELLDDEAPRTCRLVWDMLPIQHDLIHGRYSGWRRLCCSTSFSRRRTKNGRSFRCLERFSTGRTRGHLSPVTAGLSPRSCWPSVAASPCEEPKACPASGICSRASPETGSTTGSTLPKRAAVSEPREHRHFGSSAWRIERAEASSGAHPCCRQLGRIGYGKPNCPESRHDSV